MVPSYFTLARRHATPSFVHASYLHELSLGCWIFGSRVLQASSEFSDSTVEEEEEEEALCSEGFCVAVKKLPHFLYVQHGRAQNEHAESWLKFTDLQNSISSPPSSPHPLGLEVMAAGDKRAHSFINVSFSIYPAFWKTLNLHEYCISVEKKKKCPSTWTTLTTLAFFYGPRHKQPYIACQQNFCQNRARQHLPQGFHIAVILGWLIVLHESPFTLTSFLWDFIKEAMALLIQDGKNCT